MKEIFPIEGASVIVSHDMCDMNGHMNVRHYQTIPMDYDGNFYTSLGFGEDYLKSGFSTFTLEDSIRYLDEFTLGENVFPSFTLYKSNKKLLHFIGILQNESSDLAAIFETVLGHIDLNKRKIVNFSDEKTKHLQNVYLNQRKMIDIPFDIKLHIKDIDE